MPKRSSSSSTRRRPAEGDVLRGRSGAGTARTPGSTRPTERLLGREVDARRAVEPRRRRPRCARGRAAAAPRSRAAPSSCPRPRARRARPSRRRRRARRSSSNARSRAAMSSVERAPRESSLYDSRTAALRTTSRTPIASATSKFDVELLVDRRASASASRRCTLPAKMIVAPNSPTPRAKASTQPAASPPAASGSATRQKVRAGRGAERPRRVEQLGRRRPRRRRSPGAGRTARRRTSTARTTAHSAERQHDPGVRERRRRAGRRAPNAASSAMPGDRGRQHERQLDERDHERAARGSAGSPAGRRPACRERGSARWRPAFVRAVTSSASLDDRVAEQAREVAERRLREERDERQRRGRRAATPRAHEGAAAPVNRRGASRRSRRQPEAVAA